MLRIKVAFAVATAICLTNASFAADHQLAHMVYFKLKDNSYAAKEKLVVACKKHLSKHEGTVYFSVGVLAEELNREVNDLDFDVSLNLVFRNKAAHDTYQKHPRHLQFIKENKESWSNVRVFDSYLIAPAQDKKLAKRIPLPDPAASFAGMVRGVVVEKREGQFVLRVAKVTNEWEHSKADDASSLIGSNVLVEPGNHDSIRRFVKDIAKGDETTIDVAHQDGEALTILELTEEQRRRR